MIRTSQSTLLWFIIFSVIAAPVQAADMPWVRVSDDRTGFVLGETGRSFFLWGFNYDWDADGRLLED